MATRYDARPVARFNVPPLPTGYGSLSAPDDLVVPPVGLNDVDKALFNLFDKGIPFAIVNGDKGLARVPIIFSSGEKWALNKRFKAIKDRNNSLILPLITIVRTQVTQASDSDITGRGINQQTGEIVVRRRLDRSDRTYQQLVNRLGIKHQQDLAVPAAVADPMQLTSLRNVGELSQDGVVSQGGLLVSDRMDNVYETIVVPSPQFYTAQYDVTFWTQYNVHMNQLLEQLISSFLPQGNCWRIDTDTGYWFIASVDSNTYASDTNDDDYSQVEHLIRYKFSIRVPAYVLASATPGAPVPVKRYVSATSISFRSPSDPFTAGAPTGSVPDPFLGADDPTLPLTSGDDGTSLRQDQRDVDGTRLRPAPGILSPGDPALGALPRGTRPGRYQRVPTVGPGGRTTYRYLRVLSRSPSTGETVLSAADVQLGGLAVVIND